MPLVPSILAMELKILADKIKEPETVPADLELEFANIITNYIKQAQITVTGTGTGANGGGPIATVVNGTGIIS